MALSLKSIRKGGDAPTAEEAKGVAKPDHKKRAPRTRTARPRHAPKAATAETKQKPSSPRRSKAEVFVATMSGTCEIHGEPHVFIKGVTRVRAGHGLLKAVPDYFEPVDEAVHYDVEKATAEPGEQR